jgi:hypothetical protein
MMVRPAKGHPSQQFRHVSNRFDEMDPFSIEEMIEERRIQRQQANTTHTRKFGLMNLLHQKNNGIPRVIEFQGEEEQEEIEDTSDIAAPHIGMVIEVQLDEEDEKDRILRRRRSMSLDKNQRPNSITGRSQRPHASLSPKRTSIKRQNSLDDTEHGSARSSRRELTRAQGTASFYKEDVPLPSRTVTLQDAEPQFTLSQEATPNDRSAIDETHEQIAERKPRELRRCCSSESMPKQNEMRRACSSSGINKSLLTRSGTTERQTNNDEPLRNRNARPKDCMNEEPLSEQRRARWREMINEYGIVKPELQSKQPDHQALDDETKDVDARRREQVRARSGDPTDGEKHPLDRVTVSERERRRANSRDPVGEDDRPAFYKTVLAERKSKQKLEDTGAKNSLPKMRRARSMDDIEDDGPPLECVVFHRQPRQIVDKQRSDRHSYRGLPKARPRDAVDGDIPLDGRMTVSERHSRRPLADIIDTHSHREPRRACSSANIYEAKLSDRRSTQLLGETLDEPSRNERRLLARSSDMVDDDRRSSLDREGERRRASSIGNINDSKPNRESERSVGRRPLDREGERCRANSVNYINEDKPSRGSERSIASGTLGPPRASELYVSQRSATSTKSSSSLRSLQTLEPSPSSLRSISSKSFSNLLLLHSSSERSGFGRSSVSPNYHKTARPVYSSGHTSYPESASLQRREQSQDQYFTQELLKKCSTSMGDIANMQRRKPKPAYVHSLFETKTFRITGERPPKPRESTTAV